MTLRRRILEAIAGDRFLITDMHDVDEISYHTNYVGEFRADTNDEVEWTFDVYLGNEENYSHCRRELDLVMPILRGMVDNLDADIVSEFHDTKYSFPFMAISSHYENRVLFRMAGMVDDLYKARGRFLTVAKEVTIRK